MYRYWLFALSLTLCATAAAAREKSPDRVVPSNVPAADTVQPSPIVAGRYAEPGPSSARIPLVPDLDVGVGLYSVGGHFVRDRQTNGREPILGTSGRDTRIAAVGLSLRF